MSYFLSNASNLKNKPWRGSIIRGYTYDCEVDRLQLLGQLDAPSRTLVDVLLGKPRLDDREYFWQPEMEALRNGSAS
jgi:hypothetical protein